MRFAKGFDVTPIVKQQYRGLRPQGRFARSTKVFLFVLPASVGVLSALPDIHLTNLTPLLTASSLLIGVMLSLFVFIINFRVKISESESLSYRRELQKLVGSTASGSLYVALVAMTCTVYLALTASVTWDALSAPILQRIGRGILVALLAHLAANIFSIIRKIFLIYHQVFAVDFSPDLSAVPPSESNSSRKKRSSRARRTG